MPSNDAANNYSVTEQVSNYNVIIEKANEKNIPVWAATPQPRNFSQAQINLQLAMVDTTYKMFGEKAIDFWTTIAYYDSRINPLYNSGDGIHLNNAGHRILFARVVDEKILEQLNTVASIEEEILVLNSFILEQNYPNPFNPETKIRYSLSTAQHVMLRVYDMLGREVTTLVNGEQSSGIHEIVFNAETNKNNELLSSGVSGKGGYASGIYFYQLRSEHSIQSKKMILLR